VPVFELGMAAVAIAVWALAVAVIAAWLRARERSAARAHIRSIVIARRDIALSSVMKQRQTQSRTAPRQPLATPARQI